MRLLMDSKYKRLEQEFRKLDEELLKMMKKQINIATRMNDILQERKEIRLKEAGDAEVLQ